VNVVLDAGAFVAIERRDRKVGAMLRLFQAQSIQLRTSSAVVAQVWRDGRKQALVARVLQGVRVHGLTPGADKQTGELLAASRTTDVIDAHVALIVEDDDHVLTSDPDDLKRLLATRDIEATVVKT
jgi:hypothetical protein